MMEIKYLKSASIRIVGRQDWLQIQFLRAAGAVLTHRTVSSLWTEGQKWMNTTLNLLKRLLKDKIWLLSRNPGLHIMFNSFCSMQTAMIKFSTIWILECKMRVLAQAYMKNLDLYHRRAKSLQRRHRSLSKIWARVQILKVSKPQIWL